MKKYRYRNSEQVPDSNMVLVVVVLAPEVVVVVVLEGHGDRNAREGGIHSECYLLLLANWLGGYERAQKGMSNPRFIENPWLFLALEGKKGGKHV